MSPSFPFLQEDPVDFSARLGAADLARALRVARISFVAGVPCSRLQGLFGCLLQMPDMQYLSVPHEGLGLSIATGAGLAGRRSAVVLQNSGIGNLLNPLTSLVLPYAIPSLFIVSVRGDLLDAPEHHWMAKLTEPVLQECGCLLHWFRPGEDIEEVVRSLVLAMESSGRSAALLLPASTFTVSQEPAPAHRRRKQTGSAPGSLEIRFNAFAAEADVQMDVQAAIEEIMALARPFAPLVISSLGLISRMLFAVTDGPGNFYCLGSMGHSSAVALGVGLCREGPVIVLEGDGSCLMHLGALAAIGHYRPRRFLHVVLDNGVYASTGGQATLSETCDFQGLALSSGYSTALRIASPEALRAGVSEALAGEGPALLHVRCSSAIRRGLPRVDEKLTLEQIASRFSSACRTPWASSGPVPWA